MGKVPEKSILFFVVLLTCGSIFAQDDKHIRTFFAAEDLKKLEKAEKYKSEADKITAEVNQLNLEIVNLQYNTELSEKSIASKIRNLENQALQKQISASGLYEKCNEIKYTVYKNNTDNFREKNAERDSEFLNAKLLEEQAGDNFYQAISYRIEAKKLDGLVKIDKLNTANSLEVQALQKQISALQEYYGVSDQADQVSDNLPAESITAEPEQDAAFNPAPASGSKGEIVVNQAMIDSYNRYMSSGQFADTTISTGKIAAVTNFDTDNLLGLWYEYMYGIRDTSDTMEPEPEDIMADASGEPDSASPSGNEPIVIESEADLALIGEPGEVVFRVQIAANRTELSQRALSRIYYGTKNVEVLNEEGWYKYSVGDFSTYDEASEFRNQSGVSNAFVIAYRKGKKAQAEMVTTEAQAPVDVNASAENKMPAGLIFRVQIAASRVPVSVNQLRGIYKGNYPVEEVLEDGWYKYQLMGVRSYQDARRIESGLGTKGYIVAYDNGKKVTLSGAIAKSREHEAEVAQSGRKSNAQDAEFHVQLAASRSPIPAAELAILYNGPEPVFIVIENGWYKYHLKAGNSYTGALELRKNCNVKGAFIVAYIRGMKVNTYQAVQENKN